MAIARLKRFSSPQEANLLLLAALFSLWGHGVIFALYCLGLPWLHFTKPLTPAELKRAQELRQAQRQPEPQLLFVQVDPAQAVTEAPKNAKYYSTQNTKAANLDAQKDADAPKIDGTQTHVPKTDESQRAKSFPLQPSAPKTPAPPEPAKTRPEQKPGDLAMAKPPEPKPETPERQRPLRLSEVPQNKIVGDPMKQDGGVKRRRPPTFDAVGSPFGEYDARIITAIQMRWYDLVDNQGVAMEKTGKVVLDFRLNYDGTISEMKVVENTVGDTLEILCEKAIKDPQPYERWPMDMRLTVGADYREVRFTFYYD